MVFLYSTIKMMHGPINMRFILVQFRIFIFSRPAHTSSSHFILGLPTLLTATGLHSVTLFTVISLSILTICPIRLILSVFIYLTVSACLINKSFSSLVLIHQLTSWFFIGSCIFLITFLSNTITYCSCRSFSTQIPHLYDTTGLTTVIRTYIINYRVARYV